MKKQTQMLAVLSAAAFMALLPSFIGQPQTVYAAECGWTEEDGSMVFYDEDGELLTDTWRKEGNDWIYLNEDGHISKNQKIDEFYVDADGKMVRNAWVELANEEDLDSPEAPASFWYYFDENGKSITSNWLKQNEKWYYFDESGHMLTGKVNIDGSWYYLGEEHDGTMKTGWIRMKENASTPDSEEGWYYFTKNGKMIETQYDRKIDGNYYTFIDGKMQTGWVEMPKADNSVTEASDSNAETLPTIADYQYYGAEGDGKRANGWHTIEGIDGIHDMDETFTFYFRGGKALHSEQTGNQLFTVNGKKYAFNELGEMQTGQQIVNLNDGEIANYYFGDDGVMKTGKQNIYNEETGESDTWFFYTEGDRRGQGFHGLRDNTLYVYGKRQEATSDQKYASAVLNETTYLVNTSGTVQKASSSSTSSVKPELGRGFKDFKDNNGKIWTVDVNGVVQ
ncbi:MAG: cell wall-binding protein [Lachnospiraceae bacterium]|nr:cell wall-binding protein [Lachnospiraceae bacterium]